MKISFAKRQDRLHIEHLAKCLFKSNITLSARMTDSGTSVELSNGHGLTFNGKRLEVSWWRSANSPLCDMILDGVPWIEKI